MSGHTYTHTHIHTYTQDNYSNPRCACVPRVNNVMPGGEKSLYLYTCLTVSCHQQSMFKSHLSSLFSMKIEKRALRFIALFTFEV